MESRRARGEGVSKARGLSAAVLLALGLSAGGCNCDSNNPEVDAGPLPDVAMLPDVPIECTRDGECDDGLFCNGTETCELGRCASAPVDCDDGIACTVDSCSEDARLCVHDVPDVDEDGYLDALCLDARGMPLGNDCDDADAHRFPGNLEVCDDAGHDEDCNLDTRGGIDSDGDGFEDARCCNPAEAGGTNCGPDCDDARRSVSPDGVELCNGLDDDCSGEIDEGLLQMLFRDLDFDGYGASASGMLGCPNRPGYTTTGGDCDDMDVAQNPGQLEFCDMVDNDCDGQVDDNTQAVSWYRDTDGDGFGAAASGTEISCEPLTSMGYSLLSSDCDDATRAISPAAAEACNGRDDDCNGVADFEIPGHPGDFENDDGDAFPDLACGAPFGEDCDDRNAATGPGETEICDGRDNDCDADVDEGATSAVFYRDADADGYGSTMGGTIVGCMGMAGYVASGGDCDDSDPARRPGATETCNGRDDNCDGAADEGVSLAPLPHAQVACVAGMTTIVRCDPNYENCNGTTSDGCEIDLTTDEMNCRFCGNLCSSTGGETRECVAGDCRIASCPSGRRDCNGSAVDGCERTIGTTTDCSDCNDRCALAHVTRQACMSGTCSFDPATDCEPGWADCDGMVATGCETPTGTAMNCSACGDACTAMQFCDASSHTCRTSTTMCTAPLADCDGNGSCETNTTTSVTSCGSCGRACSGGNATWSCVAGGCSITACTGGFHDCDGIASNGCEASPTSVTACGASCQVCMIPNGTPACTAGSCTIGACNPGFADCNVHAGDGCETSTSTDSANCGGCGNVCNNLPNVATGTCLASSCNVVTCDPGFADCSAPNPGCETDIANDPSNCGGCGRVCGVGGACQSGTCDEVLQVANGQYHTCALRSSGTVVCWGYNANGQLGDGSTTDSLTPIVVPGLSDVVDLVAGWEHTCALLSDGHVRCWGGNSNGQLGDSTGTDQPSPVAVLDDTSLELDRVTRIESGRYTTCALRTSGVLWCWGLNNADMIASGGASVYGTATSVSFASKGGPARVSAFALGATYLAVLVPSDGRVYATGDYPGDFGPGWSGFAELWTDVSDIVEIASGNDHVCIRRLSGIVECAGSNTNGQLGDGTQITGMMPVGTLFTSATALMLFDDTTCVRNTLGQVYCMGATNEAQCTGPGSAMPVLAPRRVNVAAAGAALNASYLANGGGGAYRTPCIVSSAGAVYCWGNNIGGQIGNGNTTGQEYPTRVLGLTP
ncbi:MAG: hypothetical protein K1X94_20885 [Sandaracinaceae bacterium]|nr:hypothetical protein [Sandaracinaceae bacterium]